MVAHVDAQERVADVLNDRALNMKRPADRDKAVARMKIIEDRRLQNAHARGRALGIPLFENLPNGGWRELVDFDAEGPVFRASRNYNAAISTGANLTWTSPYGLNGSGLIVGVWDGGLGRPTHQEFATGSRLVNIDAGSMSDHAMHIAGTIGAFGVNSSTHGMANAAKIHSYTSGNDKSEMTTAGASASGQTATKIYTSNHSYGPNDGWNGNTWGGTGTDQNAYDINFGQYNYSARDIDSTIYNTPYLASFWACGNDGTDNPSNGSTVTINGQSVTYNSAIHPPGDGVYRSGYETINAESIGKNSIAIGAVNDAVTSGVRDPLKATIANFSSTGPADDGRIKPDLVANGVNLFSTGIATDTTYVTMQGTSMATPNACGSATLLVDQYNRLFSSAMRASTLKALLIHTADDIGRPGPDYFYGWGLINVKKAADLIASHATYPTAQQITESSVSTITTSRSYSFVWDGLTPITATLAWTDPAATAVTDHDSRTPTLVNNLNLKIIAPSGTEYFPYVMPFVGTWTVASMSANATTGVNNVDNVEQVRIANPGQAGTWRAEVTYSGTITNTTQDFGLIISGILQQADGVVLQSPNGGETLSTGSTQTLTWTSVIGGNVTIELLKNGTLSSTIAASTPNDGSYSWTIPTDQTIGADYKIRITSLSNPSKISTSYGDFSITAPLTLASALDTSGLTWTPSGNANWFPQSLITHDTVDAASSGTIGNSQNSSMETTVTGPGTLTFWWKVSSETTYDVLELYLNGIAQTGSNAKISGEVDWVQKTLTIPSGSQTVKWTYKKDSSNAVGFDTAWVDEVVYTPTSAPEIAVEQPVGTDLTDGSATINFGSVSTGNSSSAFTFTIRNTGTANLTGLALTKSGTHSADYTLGSLGATTLASGASTTFTATFTPGSLGARTASIQIASNDSNENPFDINLTGTGTGATYTVNFDENGGSSPVPTSISVTSGSTYGTLATTSRSGFTFIGWFTAASGGSLVTSSTTVTSASNHTLYAQWNALPVVNAGASQTVYLTQSTPWSPAQLTPQLWLDADDASTITLNGATGTTVSEWRDKSGNTRHAAQTTETSQPTRTAAALNGKSVLTFDGTTDFLNLGTGLDFLAGVSHSAFIVTKPTTFSNIYGAASGNAGANSLHVGFNGATYRMNYWGNDYGPTRTANFVAGSANIVNYIWTSGTSKQILANGKSEGTNASAGVIGTMSGGGRIGNIVGQGYIGGDIAEMVFVTGAVSTTDRESMEGYLAHKWGLTANLAAGHPYKNSAPGGSVAVATLDATATDTDTLTYAWSVVTGPASVTFANAAAIDTSASFSVAGTYTLRLTVNDGHGSVSSDVVITVSNPTPYQTWTGGPFAGTFTDTALTSNPDGDNLTNLQEFAFGMDPTRSSTAPLSYVSNGTTTPGTPMLEKAGATYRAVFARRKDWIAAGLSYTVEFSANLTYWKADATGLSILSGTSASAVEAVAIPFPATVPLTNAVGSQEAPPKFFRVAVSTN
ncbi:MAG: S8 family serine peptidase [Verrucomicrobiota bacterium]